MYRSGPSEWLTWYCTTACVLATMAPVVAGAAVAVVEGRAAAAAPSTARSVCSRARRREAELAGVLLLQHGQARLSRVSSSDPLPKLLCRAVPVPMLLCRAVPVLMLLCRAVPVPLLHSTAAATGWHKGCAPNCLSQPTDACARHTYSSHCSY